MEMMRSSKADAGTGRHRSAGGILAMAFLFAVISSVGDILQITQGLPFAVVNILMAVILFIVLGRQPARSTGR